MSDTTSRNSIESYECKKCGKPLSLKSLTKQPIGLQILFGFSFVLFLIFNQKIVSYSVKILWVWSFFQIAIGFLLFRARIKARQKVYRCLYCQDDLP